MHRMKRHTAGRLHDQHQQTLRIALDTVVKWTTSLQFTLEGLDRHDLSAGVRHLQHRFAAHHHAAKECVDPDQAFVTDCCDFHHRAIFMTVVIDATPPFRKNTSRTGSFTGWRICLTVREIVLRWGRRRSKSSRGRQASSLFFGRESTGGERIDFASFGMMGSGPEMASMSLGCDRTRKAAAGSKERRPQYVTGLTILLDDIPSVESVAPALPYARANTVRSGNLYGCRQPGWVTEVTSRTRLLDNCLRQIPADLLSHRALSRRFRSLDQCPARPQPARRFVPDRECGEPALRSRRSNHSVIARTSDVRGSGCHMSS